MVWQCTQETQLVQLSNPTVVFCCNLLTHDEKGQRWHEAERPPVVHGCLCWLVSGHFALPHRELDVMWPDWVRMCLYLKENPGVIRLTKTIRAPCIMLHQNAVKLVRRRTCRFDLDEELPDLAYILQHNPSQILLAAFVLRLNVRCHSCFGYYRNDTVFTPDVTVVTSHHIMETVHNGRDRC